MRIWALPAGVALLALVGAALSAEWPAQIVIPAAVLLGALLYLFVRYSAPPERQ